MIKCTVICIFVTLIFILSVASVWNDSAIIDEVEHIGAGYSLFLPKAPSFNLTHPPVIKLIAAFPLLLFPLNTASIFTVQEGATAGVCYSFNFLYGCGNDVRLILLVTRVAVITWNIFLLFYFWTLLYRRFGHRIAFTATFLLITSTTFFAHFRYVMMDVPASLSCSIFLLLYSKAIERPTFSRFFHSLAWLIIAIMTKYSALWLLPTTFLTFILLPKDRKTLFFHMGLIGVPLVLTLLFFCRILPGTSLHATSIHLIKGLKGILERMHAGGTDKGYLAGQLYHGGVLLFFPVLFLLKESMVWLLVTAIGIGNLIKYQISTTLISNYRKTISIVFSIFIVSYSFIAIFSQINLGLRYLLPIYPPLCLLTALGLHEIRSLKLNFNKLSPVIFPSLLLPLIISFPRYLSYFNFFGGGSNGYVWGIDSNFDWGQDAIRLADWVKENNINQIYIDFFGRGQPFYFIPDRWVIWDDFRGVPPRGSLLAISISKLQQSRARRHEEREYGRAYEWVDVLTPLTRIGDTILVYEVP